MRSLRPKTIPLSFPQIILPLLLSAFICWLFCWLLIKALFRPINPVKIVGFKLQGIVPTNQKMMAEKIGSTVAKELINFSALQDKITSPDNFNKLKPEIETHIDDFLRVRLKDTFPMLGMLIGDKTINQLKTAFMGELENLFPVIMKSYMSQLETDLNIEKTVADKIAAISIQKIEKAFYLAAAEQLIRVQLAAALFGLMMGLLHLFLNCQLYR